MTAKSVWIGHRSGFLPREVGRLAFFAWDLLCFIFLEAPQAPRCTTCWLRGCKHKHRQYRYKLSTAGADISGCALPHLAADSTDSDSDNKKLRALSRKRAAPS
jgi:hypothetical protein